MTHRGSLIDDFLDQPDRERREGIYTFTEEDHAFLSDIPIDRFYYRVLNDPSSVREGRVAISINDQNVADVFSTSKASVFTYVRRSVPANHTYEAVLELALREPGRSLVLYGPSKVGKSALWKHVLGSSCVVAPCSPYSTLADHYLAALAQLEESWVATAVTGIEDTAEHGIEAKINAGGPGIMTGEVTAKKAKGSKTSEQTMRKYFEGPVTATRLSRSLAKRRLALVFENYHRLSEDAFNELAIDLRTFEDERVTTVFVGIPTDPHAFIRLNQELLARMVFLEFRFWPQTELEKIALHGAGVLNVSFSGPTLKFLSAEAAGSPLLMQLYCLVACLASGVSRSVEVEADVDLSPSDFATAMKRLGMLYLEPCGAIWEACARECALIKSLGEGFSAKISECLRAGVASLVVERGSLGGASKRGLRALVRRLNRNELTREVIQTDGDCEVVTVANPNVFAYLRWLA